MANAKVIEPPKDGVWWIAEKNVRKYCPYCEKTHSDPPTVMAYVESLDHGGIQARKEHGWKELGWLTWWQCPNDHNWHEAVSVEQVRQWGRTHGGWHQMR